MTQITPEPFIDAVLGYQKTAAIKAAVALDLFTALGEGIATAPALAARTGAAARGIAVLCDTLAVHGFLEKTGARYTMTPSTRMFLDANSPGYMGRVVEFLAAPEMITQFLDDPTAYVNHGGAAGLANVSPDNPVWITFAESMVGFITPIAHTLAQGIAASVRPPAKVLDVAAGHGMFGIALAQMLPEARITAVDWSGVLGVAKRNAERAGVADRYSTVAGSAFDVDWGGGYDLVMLPNFLHHFDADTCMTCLRKARASLAAGGRVLAVEFVPNEDRVSPAFPALFSFIMLATTPKGRAYTAAELDVLARGAGFAGATVSPLSSSPASLVEFRD